MEKKKKQPVPVPLPQLLFARKKPNGEHLINFGFQQQGGEYTYKTGILAEQFQMTVVVSREGNVDTTLTERDSGEEYVLHRVPGAEGAFIGAIREEYEAVLREISEKCFDPDVFQSPVTKEIIRYVGKAYQNEPEFLWKRFPDNVIFRRQDTQKWYGLLVTLAGEKLGLRSKEMMEALVLRGEPDEITTLVDGTKYFPAYHMNKQHWYTIRLDGSVPVEEVCRKLDTSYQLAVS